MLSRLASPLLAPIRRLAGVRRELLVVLANVAAYALCFQMQQPLQLYLTKQLVEGSQDATAAFATIRTANGVLQLVGSLLSGLLIDRFGVGGVFVLSFAASALHYAMIVGASSWQWLAVAQLPTMLQHAVLAARAYVALHTRPEDRSMELGLIGSAYGVGFVIGPMVGGLLSRVSLTLPAALSTVGSLASIVWLWRALPSSGEGTAGVKSAAHGETAGGGDSDSGGPRGGWRAYASLLTHWPLMQLFLVRGTTLDCGCEREGEAQSGAHPQPLRTLAPSLADQGLFHPGDDDVPCIIPCSG